MISKKEVLDILTPSFGTTVVFQNHGIYLELKCPDYLVRIENKSRCQIIQSFKYSIS